MAPLPTEEDILAHLVLRAARPVTTNIYSTEQQNERDAWNAAVALPRGVTVNPIAVLAMGRVGVLGSLEAAITDSEHRWAVECAEREALEAVRDGYSVPLNAWGSATSSGRPGIWARLMGAEGKRRAYGSW